MSEFENTPNQEGLNQEASQNEIRKEEVAPTNNQELNIDTNSFQKVRGPEAHLFDPEISLPINSEKLDMNLLQPLVDEIDHLTCGDISDIQKLQKSIDAWEAKVEENKALMDKNRSIIRNNKEATNLDQQNRDYWWRRSDNVLGDFKSASAANHINDWSWFIKKHGIKDLEGSALNVDHDQINDLCRDGADKLAGKYRTAGDKFDSSKKDREDVSFRLISENGRLRVTNETLQKYIQSTYQVRIEPLQDGVLLMKELGAKMRAYMSSNDARFGDLRGWAENFLNQYLIENPRTPQSAINEFRRVASIPLPSENS